MAVARENIVPEVSLAIVIALPFYGIRYVL